MQQILSRVTTAKWKKRSDFSVAKVVQEVMEGLNGDSLRFKPPSRKTTTKDNADDGTLSITLCSAILASILESSPAFLESLVNRTIRFDNLPEGVHTVQGM